MTWDAELKRDVIAALAADPAVDATAVVHRSLGQGSCDAEIADNVEHMIRWTTVDPNGFRVAVDHGWVTLEGEAGCEFERCIVENVIRPLPGVAGVTNQVAVGLDR
jgi:osmotically-inducible protein OsmY